MGTDVELPGGFRLPEVQQDDPATRRNTELKLALSTKPSRRRMAKEPKE